MEKIRKQKEQEKNSQNFSDKDLEDEMVVVTIKMNKYLLLLGIVVAVGTVIAFGQLYKYLTQDK